VIIHQRGRTFTKGDADRRLRFELLVADVYDPLQRYLRRRLDTDSVPDALSETLLIAWRRLDDIPADGGLPWCYGVARRVVANEIRSRRRYAQLVSRLEAERPVGVESGEVSDPDLEFALSTLPEGDREILRLWAWEGLEPREIAPVLELTVNAATLRLSRARKKLGSALERQNREVSGQLPVDMPGSENDER
jgi:RNA polymerase sigma-70 factor, ECF subfamily